MKVVWDGIELMQASVFDEVRRKKDNIDNMCKHTAWMPCMWNSIKYTVYQTSPWVTKRITILIKAQMSLVRCSAQYEKEKRHCESKLAYRVSFFFPLMCCIVDAELNVILWKCVKICHVMTDIK